MPSKHFTDRDLKVVTKVNTNLNEDKKKWQNENNFDNYLLGSYLGHNSIKIMICFVIFGAEISQVCKYYCRPFNIM